MKDLSERQFSDLIYETLEKLNYNEVLSNPTTESKYPLLELHSPLKSVNKTIKGQAVYSRFQISITCWNAKTRECMEMVDEVDTCLQKLNIVRTNITPSMYDSILQKYNRTATYEVDYNALLGSFNLIK